VTRTIRRHYAVQGTTHDVDLTLDHARLVGHLDGRAVSAEARVVRAFEGGADVVVAHDGGRTRAVVLRDGDVVHVALGGRTFRLGVVAARQEAAAAAAAPNGADPFVASPMTGVVRQVAAAAGKSFAAGETLVVVEAMKMEFAVEAPRPVVVDEVRAKAGDRVDIGHVLVTFRGDAK
jgi:acetyl/propionyl-CoA carboxylase alpha subunit